MIAMFYSIFCLYATAILYSYTLFLLTVNTLDRVVTSMISIKWEIKHYNLFLRDTFSLFKRNFKTDITNECV